MSYVDAFVLVVPKKNRAKYKKMAKQGCELWTKHGATGYFECVGDELEPEWCGMPFPKLTKCKDDEEVWYSFIIYKNKSERNRINAKVMKEMDKLYPEHSAKDMPFDMKKMTYGGFKAEIEA